MRHAYRRPDLTAPSEAVHAHRLGVVGAALTAGLVGLAPATTAAQSGPYLISAGQQTAGAVPHSAVSGTLSYDTSAGLALSCDQATAIGDVTLGPSTDGVGVARVVSSTYKNCVGPLGLPVDVTQIGTWRVDLHGPAGTVTASSVEEIASHVENPDGQCSFVQHGSVVGSWDSSTQQYNVFTDPTESSGLTISNVDGCFGLINEGDTAQVTATYDVSNPTGPFTVS